MPRWHVDVAVGHRHHPDPSCVAFAAAGEFLGHSVRPADVAFGQLAAGVGVHLSCRAQDVDVVASGPARGRRPP